MHYLSGPTAAYRAAASAGKRVVAMRAAPARNNFTPISKPIFTRAPRAYTRPLFSLTLHTFRGTRWEVSMTNRLRLSRLVDVCKPLPRTGEEREAAGQVSCGVAHAEVEG